MVRAKPLETLECFLPVICTMLIRAVDETAHLYKFHEENHQLSWYLSLFEATFTTRGNALIPYKMLILSTLEKIHSLNNRAILNHMAKEMFCLISALTQSRIIECATSDINFKEPFVEWLPIDVRFLEKKICRTKYNFPFVFFE